MQQSSTHKFGAHLPYSSLVYTNLVHIFHAAVYYTQIWCTSSMQQSNTRKCHYQLVAQGFRIYCTILVHVSIIPSGSSSRSYKFGQCIQSEEPVCTRWRRLEDLIFLGSQSQSTQWLGYHGVLSLVEAWSWQCSHSPDRIEISILLDVVPTRRH